MEAASESGRLERPPMMAGPSRLLLARHGSFGEVRCLLCSAVASSCTLALTCIRTGAIVWTGPERGCICAQKPYTARRTGLFELFNSQLVL